MKIWFDLSNSPHVNLFSPIIQKLRKDFEIVITTRPLGNAIELLELHGFDFTVVGKHYGANRLKKAVGYPIRILQLYQHLRR